MPALKDKRILVTGGAGFIGSELVRQVVSAGAEVLVVDNMVNGKKANIQDVLSDRVQLVVQDIRDDLAMKDLLRGIDTVFHLACLGVRHSIHAPRENHEVNASATLTLLIRAREANVERFVYVSSSEVYGTARTVPMTEAHPAFPQTVYGASKLAGDCYTRAFWETHRFPALVVRPFNSFGPRSHHEGDSGEVIPKFLLRTLAGKSMIVFGDGTQTRDFTYVEDSARGILMAALSDRALGQTINLASGREISINELSGLVAQVAGVSGATVEHIEPRPGDVLRLYADTGRAEKMLGFKSSIQLRDGLARLKAWYLSSGMSPEKLLEQEKVRNWQ